MEQLMKKIDSMFLALHNVKRVTRHYKSYLEN